MYRLFSIIAIFVFSPIFAIGQIIIKEGQEFTQVSLVENKVIFVKEIPANKEERESKLFLPLKNWGREHYAKDPFVSNIYYNDKNNEFVAKSRIELLLPEDREGVREKITMRYRINGFVYQSNYIFEVSDVDFVYKGGGYKKLMPKVVKAEDFITDEAVNVNDKLQEFRQNTRKSTLYFMNELGRDFEAINSEKNN